MTLSPTSRDELYTSSLIQVLVYLDIIEGNIEVVFEHLSHSPLVPKYNLDYVNYMDVGESKSYEEAIVVPDSNTWLQAMRFEMDSINQACTTSTT